MSIATMPRRVLDGFGGATRSVSNVARPETAADVANLFARASEEHVKVAMRGSGRSYGDAALNGGGLVLDMTAMRRVLAWDPATGVADIEPGVTIEDLWRTFLRDGWWPAVVPGTMFPTLGGCAAMNVHGKNHFKVGGTGDSILDADLVTPKGEILHVSREENADLFHAAVAGFGMLGTFSRLRIQLKKMHSGKLKVWPIAARSLAEQFELFEQHCPESDYVVSWVDCIAGGNGLGRGQVHRAVYVHDDVAPDFDPAHQDLPGHILGVPRALVGKLLATFNNNPGMRLLNIGKYLASRFGPKAPYTQGHVAFAFLLDYVPNWRGAYDPHGFIQYQPFVPKAHAPRVFAEILKRTQAAGMPSYLGVIKRHRPDDFLLSHVVDGYSFAMDYPVTPGNRADLWKLLHGISDMVVEAGGRFYPAKDYVIRPQDFQRAWGQERISQFRGLRRRVDPNQVLSTEWARRVGVDET